jgi:hypothetical protein
MNTVGIIAKPRDSAQRDDSPCVGGASRVETLDNSTVVCLHRTKRPMRTRAFPNESRGSPSHGDNRA